MIYSSQVISLSLLLILLAVSLISLSGAFILGFRFYRHNKKLSRETDDLKALIETREKFSATAVHDLKNPITTIKLYTQLIENKKLGQRADKILNKSTDIIERETDKLLILADQLLDYSKIQNGKFTINKDKFDLYKLCQSRIEAIKKSYPENKFVFTTSDKKINICGDKMAIDRMLTNLLINAAKYSPKNKPVKLTLDKINHFCQMTISDHGKGIKKDKQKLLFEPFFQADENSHGLGLGLYIVKSLVELHKGKISLKSSKSTGTVFSISLPLF